MNYYNSLMPIVKNSETGETGILLTNIQSEDNPFFVPVVYRSDVIGTHFFEEDIGKLEGYSPKSEDVLTKRHIQEVCKEATDEQCAFLCHGDYYTTCIITNSDIDALDIASRIVRRGDGRMNCEGKFKTYIPEK